MARKSNQVRWIVAIAGIGFLAVLIYSSIRQAQFKYEVCVQFKGGSYCATASSATANEAIRSAHEIDCSQLANGRDENMACLDTQPTSVREIQ